MICFHRIQLEELVVYSVYTWPLPGCTCSQRCNSKYTILMIEFIMYILIQYQVEQI